MDIPVESATTPASPLWIVGVVSVIIFFSLSVAHNDRCLGVVAHGEVKNLGIKVVERFVIQNVV